MVRLQKWFSPRKSSKRPKKVAAEVISQRLSGVAHFLRASKSRGRAQVEAIHQLRVWCRRSEAALKLFKSLLVKKKPKQLLAQLKELRRAAGPLRDRDVLLAQLEVPKASPVMSTVAKSIRAARESLEPALEKLRKRMLDRGELAQWQKKVSQLFRDEKCQQSMVEFYREQIQPLADDFFEQSHVRPRAVAALHELRISGKRLRYAMEIAASAFDESFRDVLYARFTLVQERLGTICDHATQAQEYLALSKQKGGPRERAWLVKAAARETKLAREKIARFRTWWNLARQTQMKKLLAKIVGTTTAAE